MYKRQADIHPTAGVVAVGARMPLVAYNVNLNTSDLSIADAIAKKVRHIGGGLRFCKAMGVELTDRHIVQVSMNLTDYTKTAVYRAHEMVRMEARRYGVGIVWVHHRNGAGGVTGGQISPFCQVLGIYSCRLVTGLRKPLFGL